MFPNRCAFSPNTTIIFWVEYQACVYCFLGIFLKSRGLNPYFPTPIFLSSVRRPQYVALDAAFASDGAFFVTACDHGGIYYHSTSVPNAFQRALGGDREPRDSDFSGTCGQMRGNHGTVNGEGFQSRMHSH